MKRYRILFFLMTALMACPSVAREPRKKVVNDIYAFGLAASFKDSLAFFTDVQRLDSARVNRGNGFLTNRKQYAEQLKDYLEVELGKPNYTCTVFYADKKERLEKTFKKLKLRYGKTTLIVKNLTAEVFKFTKPDEE